MLSIVAIGHVHAEHLAPLTTLHDRLEELVLDIDPRDPLSKHRAELNRAIDAARADWILVIREREIVDEPLAKELSAAMNASQAWGFRIRTTPIYAGKPLVMRRDGGEVRLFHKRHYLRFANKGEWTEINVQGTVIRLQNAFRAMSFATCEEHRQQLAKSGVPHSGVRRVLLFLAYAWQARTLDANTLRYLWIEAAFDGGS